LVREERRVRGHPGFSRVPEDGECPIVVLVVHQDAGGDLLLVADTRNGARLLARLGKDREENGGKDGDDRNHHQQLDQGKRSPVIMSAHVSLSPTRSLIVSASYRGAGLLGSSPRNRMSRIDRFIWARCVAPCGAVALAVDVGGAMTYL